MKKLLLLLCGLSFTTTSIAADECSTTFNSVLERHTGALDARNLDTFIATIAPRDEQMMILPDGSYWQSIDAIRDGHKAWFDDKTWVFNKTLVRKDKRSTWGLVVYKVTVDRPQKPGNPFLLSMLFAPEDNGCWYLQHDQNTLLPIAENETKK